MELGFVLGDYEIRSNPELRGMKAASFFIDDTIWVLRDIARHRPKSIFDHPFLAVLKEAHDRFGLRLQLNLFYRTDFYYGVDEFTLAEVPADYRAEWQTNRDWLRLGFHSLQEFPDYPWVNMGADGVANVFDREKLEIERFAGEGVLALAVVPHWCPMSKSGVGALMDRGVRLMECTAGIRRAYDGDRNCLPYGHALRLEMNRKPETAIFTRESRDCSITASICAYNHLSPEQLSATVNSFAYVHDNVTGMNFKHLFGDAPVLNLVDVTTLVADTKNLLGREYLVFSDHEQYFYRDYVAYQPDYAEKIMLMSRMMSESGHRFILIEDVVA
jgi:hypothetical protein